MGSLTLANFNITFGQNNVPMMDYFDTIVYPAFISGIKRKHEDKIEKIITNYFFDSVYLKKIDSDEYVLIGYFIKDTMVSIKSIYADGELVNEHKKHPNAPYSVFIVFLKNHRVVLYKNEKQSPDIRSFNVATRVILKEYVNRVNNNIIKEDLEKRLPYPIVNIVGIPMPGEIRDKLSQVKKIKKMNIKLYPLNGDSNFVSALSEMREMVGSKTATYALNSPQSKKGVEEMINNLNGTVDISLAVEYMSGAEGVISSDKFTEKTSLTVYGETIDEVSRQIISNVEQMDQIKNCTDENRKIFERNRDKLKNLL